VSEEGAGRVLDLSHVLSEDMPVYPGTKPPSISQATTIERDGFAEKLLSLYSHTGTHMDAPCHMVPGAPSLDAMDAGRFVGKGMVLDLTGLRAPVVEEADVSSRLRRLEGADFVLLRTDWSLRWGTESYFSGFPVLSPEAARRLAELGLSGVGTDCISVDPVGSPDFPIHGIFLARGMLIVENLRDLASLGDRPFVFSCLPLRIRDADGSPIRAVAIY
jgi:arylformamidase